MGGRVYAMRRFQSNLANRGDLKAKWDYERVVTLVSALNAY